MRLNLRKTESEIPELSGIDTWIDAKILRTLVAGQERAIASVKAAIPMISEAANIVATCLAQGGRLFYAGAGTSIRIGVQDGSELPATFGMSEDRLVYLIAGGRAAMFESFADAEDDAAEGGRAASICKAGDALIAIAASGSTPYTIGAARRASELGASVIAVANNPNSPLAAWADVEIFLDSGPEVIIGSTRMGAGTAQKAALNLLSTLTHIKLGAVHDGMMINVKGGNAKLKARACKIVSRIASVDERSAAAALELTKGEIKTAILISAGAMSPDNAQQLLKESQGNLRQALSRLALPA